MASPLGVDCSNCGARNHVPVPEACRLCGSDLEEHWSCECMHESEADHDAAYEEAERDFLNSPGAPPSHMSAKGIARAREGMAEARKRLGMEER